MATTDFDIATDFPNGVRVCDVTNKLRVDWGDATVCGWVKGTSAQKPDQYNVCDGGTLTIESASTPSAGQITALETWASTYNPGTGLDATYTNLPKASDAPEGCISYGLDGGDSTIVANLGGAWRPIALVEDIPSGGTATTVGATASAEDGITSTTYVVVNSMSITPGAGTWMVMFVGAVEMETAYGVAALFYDGTIVSDTETELEFQSSPTYTNVTIVAPAIVVATGKSIDARCNVQAASTTKFLSRSIVAIKVG